MTTSISRRIHLVAPSGYCVNQQAAERGIQRLRAAGHQVDNSEIISRRDNRFAGTDQQRAEDLNGLLDSLSQPDIVLAVRGGYGATRLLPFLAVAELAGKFRSQPTIFCGHSDFTAIQLALLTQGMITFSGPMLAANFGALSLSAFTTEHFWNTITQQQITLHWQSCHSACDISGTIWGGNLAMVTSLIGTRWMPEIDGGILVIEDINEPAYKVERMLLQLAASGILMRQNAIVCGDFSGYAPDDNSLDTVWHYLRTVVNCPIITGLPYGHEPDTVTLPIGAQGHLRIAKQNVALTINNYPWLPTDDVNQL